MFKGQIVDDAGDSDWNLTFSLIVLELEVHIPFIAVMGRIGDGNTEFHRFCFPGGDYSVHGGNGNWRVDSRKNGTGMEFIYVITATLEDTFVVSPLLMFPVLKVIGMIGFRILAILDIFLMILVGALCGRGCRERISIHIRYMGTAGVESVDSLLTRGGMSSMLETTALIFCAVSYGGVLETTGTLCVLVEKILNEECGNYLPSHSVEYLWNCNGWYACRQCGGVSAICVYVLDTADYGDAVCVFKY